MMKMLQEDLVDPDKLMVKPRRVKDGKLSVLRMATNTHRIRQVRKNSKILQATKPFFLQITEHSEELFSIHFQINFTDEYS